MNKITTINLFIFAIFITAFQLTYGQGLTRPQAAQMIIDFYQQPNASINRLSLSNADVMMAKLKPLVSEGLVYVDKSQPLWEYALTEEGKKYAIKNSSTDVAVGINCFKEITGIKYTNSNETSAIVEYTVSLRHITPFGIHLKFVDGMAYNLSVKMDKYDDGWRIVGVKQVTNISDVPFFGIKGITKKNCCN